MKLKAFVEPMRAAIAPLDTPQLRALYRARDPSIPLIDRSKDLDMRYRWDLYWRVPDELRRTLYRANPDVLDAYIDTLLRQVVKPLGEET